MVKVLPEPVTPSSTWSRSCERTPLTNSSIACGWSPSGSNSETTRKRRPPSDLSGRGGRCGTHGGRLRILGSPSSSSAFSESADTAAPVSPRGWLSGAGVSNFGCGASPKPRRPFLPRKGGIEQLGEMLVERLQVRARRLGLRRGVGFSGGRHGDNMGRIGGWGKGDRGSIAVPARPRLEHRTSLARRRG